MLILPTHVIANENIGDLLRELKGAKSKQDRYQVLTQLSVRYCDFNLDSAQFWADQFFHEIENTKNPDYLSKAYSVYGYVFEKRGDYEKALYYQKKSLKYALKATDKDQIANAYNGLGVMYDFSGDYDKALENYFKSYEIRKENKHNVGMQQSLSNIGLVYHLKGDFKNALKYLYQSRDLAEEIKDTPGYSSALINIALVFQQQKSYRKALSMYYEALEIYRKDDAIYDMALVYNNLGSTFFEMKIMDSALLYHRLSLKVKKEVGDLHGLIMTYQNIGLIQKETGNLDSAEIYLLEGKHILDSLPDPVNQIELFNTIGEVYLIKGNLNEAENYLNKALETYQNGTEYYKIYITYKHLSKLNFNKGNYRFAYEYSEKYWRMVDSIQNNENAKVIQQKEIESEFKAKEREEGIKRELEKEADQKQRRIWNIFYLCLLFSMIIVMGFIYRNYRIKKKANGLLSERNSIISNQNVEIRKQSELLEEKNRDITASIQYAKRLQDAILPSENEMNLVMKDYFVLYKPKDIVSGDFYWMHDLSSNHTKKYLFAVVDCTGHGVPGGFVSIVGNNALNRAVNEFGLILPNLILDKISSLVESSFESENTEIRDGMDMALISVTENHNGYSIEYAGANNPIWIFQNQEFKEIKADKQPIGRYENKKPFQLHKFELQKGDCLYLFSDGYADQFGGPSGKKFKYAQLKDVMKGFTGKSMSIQKMELENTINNWKGELEQIDDICIAGIRV